MDLDERLSGRPARVLAVFVLAVAVTSTLAQLLEGGPAAALDGVVFVYIAVILAYGVFREKLESPTVQVAFGLGIGAYGTILYFDTRSLLWLGLTSIAIVLVVRNLLYLSE